MEPPQLYLTQKVLDEIIRLYQNGRIHIFPRDKFYHHLLHQCIILGQLVKPPHCFTLKKSGGDYYINYSI